MRQNFLTFYRIIYINWRLYVILSVNNHECFGNRRRRLPGAFQNYEEGKAMKKFLSFLTCLALVLSLSGCSGESHEEEIKTAIDSYFSAIQAGDYDAALQAAAGDSFQDNFGLSQVQEQSGELLDDTLGEVYNSEAKAFVEYVLSKSISEYTIGDIQEDGDQATAEVTGKCLDFETMDVSIGEVDTDTLTENYLTEHMDELSQIYSEQGEEAVNQKIMDDCAPLIFDQMKTAVDSIETRDFDMQITLTQTDGKWLISQIDELQQD